MAVATSWRGLVGIPILILLLAGPVGPAADGERVAAGPTGPTTAATVTPAPAAPTPVSAPTAAAGIWQPPVVAGWQWQIDGTPLDLGPAQRGETIIYNIDYEYYSSDDVARLHALGQRVWCYVPIGVYESYRPDAAQFPADVIGGPTGWPDEFYLDIRRFDAFASIIEARFDLCRAKGFDGIEGDYQNNLADDTVSPWAGQITLAQQEAFNQWFIAAAHERGLSAGLKNAPEHAGRWAQWPDAVHPHGYDWALNEQCFEFDECQDGPHQGYSAFVNSGRPVFQVEYNLPADRFCARANALNFNSLVKRPALDPYREPCR